MNSQPRVLYYEVLHFQPATLKWLEDQCDLVRCTEPGAERASLLETLDAVIAPRGYSFDREFMCRCPKLSVVASCSVVVPHIDLEAAAERSIRVVSLEGQSDCLVRITATAELAFGLILALTRHLPSAHAAASSGHWGGRLLGQKTPRMLSSMSLGIVGLGRLGSMVARYGAAFGMRVSYTSPTSRDSRFRHCSTLEELASVSDVLSLHCLHIPSTTGIVNRGVLGALRPGSFLVNTARGELIDEGALLESLESGHIAGAGLDVLSGCTAPDFPARVPTHPLVRYARCHENLILTPYYGGATLDSWQATEQKTVELLMASLHGR